MGGTLPIIVKYMSSIKAKVGFNTALAYSINTLGAVTGCLAAGLFTLYFIGIRTSIYAAGVIDIIIGIILYMLFKEACVSCEPQVDLKDTLSYDGAHEETLEHGTLKAYVVIAAFALSGFASLAYEVLWTRVLSLIIGSSVYAFTVMLATFLLGIGLGSIIFAPFVDRRKNPLMWFAGFEALIAFQALYLSSYIKNSRLSSTISRRASPRDSISS